MSKTKKLVNEIVNLKDTKVKNDLTFYQLKVIEESSEVINELADSLTKPKNNINEIQAEIADLKARLLLYEAKMEKEGFESFSGKIELLTNKKLRKILKYRRDVEGAR